MDSTNPYQPPPPALATPARDAGPSSTLVLEMVRSQRGMMWLFAAKLGMDVTFSMARELMSQPAWYAYLAMFLLVQAAMAYFVFRLANAIYGLGPGIVCGVLAVLQCFGLLVVLILNGTTIDRLRKAGVKVGFMGATRTQLEELANPQDQS